MKNPTCPATVLEPKLHDMFSRKRRSLEVEAAHFNVLSGRATDCTLNNWVRLTQFATVLFTASHSNLNPLFKVWDEEFAGYFDVQLEHQNLLEFLHTCRAYQPRAVVEWILYNPARAGPGIRGADLASRSLCRTVGPRARSDDLSNVAQRGVDAWNTGSLRDIPNLDTILSAILSGVIALHYARWQYFRNEVNGNRPGPMLELAYWLGQRPGQSSSSDDIHDYQDHTYREDELSDQWSYLHFDPSHPRWLVREGGNTYAGVHDMRVYHGQYWMPGQGGRAWRVSNQNRELNRRSGFNCPQELEDSLWYIGSQITFPEGVPDWAELLNRWGEMVYRRGYVSVHGLRLIMNPPAGGAPDEIDPENPGELSLGGMGTPEVGGQNPYSINFLINGPNYDFVPEAPPPDREDPNRRDDPPREW